MPDRMTRLIDIAAELHGVNRTEIVVRFGVCIAGIERRTSKPPHIILEEVPESEVIDGAKEGLDGVEILAAPLRLRAARQLERDQRAAEDARAVLAAAEARAKKTAALIERLADLVTPGGFDG